jgi:benzaldehyde dehydrogenase (NAD)
VEEAVACANDNEYGLSAAVFGRDIARAFNVARKHRQRHLPCQRPHGARRGADALRRRQGQGIGRFGGKAGIAEFTELRWITVQTTPRHYPF